MFLITDTSNIGVQAGQWSTRWGVNVINKLPEIQDPLLNTGTVYTAFNNQNTALLHYPGNFIVWNCTGIPVVSDGKLSGFFELTTSSIVQPPSWVINSKKRVFFRFALEVAAALQPLYAWDSAQLALENARSFYNSGNSALLQPDLLTDLSNTLNKPAFGGVTLAQIAAGASARAALSLALDSAGASLYLGQAAQCLHFIGYRLYGLNPGIDATMDAAVAAVAANSSF